MGFIHKVLRRAIVPIVIVLLGASSIHAGRISNVGTTAASFLEVGVGSRAIGMGGAFVAVANDATTLYWNPAGLAELTGAEAVFERIDWLADIHFNFFGAAVPMGAFGTLGVSINAMTVPKDKVRTLVYQDGTGEQFDASSIAAGLSYAFRLTDRFAIGFNAKYISERIWHESAASFAFDVGTMYHTGFEGLRIGAAISNFGPDMQMSGSDLLIYHDIDPLKLGNNDKITGNLETDKWPLPLNMQFGIAYDINFGKTFCLTTAVDAIHPINDTEYVNVGAELNLFDILFVRGGYKAIGQVNGEQGVTLGCGLQYRLFGQSMIHVDYAYADFGRLEAANRFTLRLNF